MLKAMSEKMSSGARWSTSCIAACLVFQLRAGHGSEVVEHHGEVQWGALGFFLFDDGGEVNLHDDLRRRVFQHDFAVGDEFDFEGFSGQQVRGDDCGQTEKEQCFLRAPTLPNAQMNCQAAVKGL